MRTIKFRGKRTDNGEWVYGGYIDENTIAVPVNDYSANYYGIDDFEVIPETVGQFTGLFDKDGAEIYEGDIVETGRGCAGDYFVEESQSKIVFSDGEFIPEIITQKTYFLPDGCWWEISKVIGNIHDKTSDQ